ncbi:unnamed protein product [Trichogramma brassicae]|uniref:Uncharacterized protein n=1 Tax=Trichogramma brassicae TaxID=86971 RepID=A0A6H5IWV3_9HYME|nr:unnamed protein product [Trichogramma brassicae]
MIERWHRDFKTALMCFEGEEEWTKALPLVMLGLRTRIRSDIDASHAEIMYGSTLRLRGVFFSGKGIEHDLHFFTKEVRTFLKSIKLVLTSSHNQAKPFVHKNLATCSHVFVRANPIKKALESPYKGPFKVHARPSKYFYVVRIINKAGREELKTVSTSRIKPAFGTFRDIDQFILDLPQPETQNFDEAQLVDDFDVVKAPDVPFEVQTRQKPVRKNQKLAKICKRAIKLSTTDQKINKNKKESDFVTALTTPSTQLTSLFDKIYWLHNLFTVPPVPSASLFPWLGFIAYWERQRKVFLKERKMPERSNCVGLSLRPIRGEH